MISDFLQSIRERLAILPPQTRIAWKWDLATGFFAGIYQGSIWVFVLRVARADMRASGAQMAWITAAPAIGYIFATIWARQMEGRSKLPFVYWTWLFARGAFLLAPLIRSREQFVFLVCITPIVFSISTPAYTATMKDIYPDQHRGRLMSMARIVMNLAMLVTSLVMGRLLDHGLDYRLAFAFGGVFGSLSAWTFSRIPLPPPEPSEEPRISTRAFFADTFDILRRNPGYRWFTASVFVSGFGNLVATTLYPIHQVDHFQITNTQVANMQNIASLLTVAGFFFWGGFLDRRGPLSTVLVAIAFNLMVPLFYVYATDVRWLYLAAGCSGIAVSGIDLGYINTTLMFAEPGKAAQYQALHSSFFGIRGTIAPQFAIPWMRAAGARSTFQGSFIIMVAGVWLQLISMRDFRRQANMDRKQSIVAVEEAE